MNVDVEVPPIGVPASNAVDSAAAILVATVSAESVEEMAIRVALVLVADPLPLPTSVMVGLAND